MKLHPACILAAILGLASGCAIVVYDRCQVQPANSNAVMCVSGGGTNINVSLTPTLRLSYE